MCVTKITLLIYFSVFTSAKLRQQKKEGNSKLESSEKKINKNKNILLKKEVPTVIATQPLCPLIKTTKKNNTKKLICQLIM